MSAMLALVADHYLNLDEHLSHLLAPWVQKQASLLAQAQVPVSGTEVYMPPPRVQVFQLELGVVMDQLESKAPLRQDTITRLGGERPLDRTALALFLGNLAQSLNEVPVALAKHRVLALDFDVVPLAEELPGCAETTVERLRSQAVVAALTRSIDALRRANGVDALVVLARSNADVCERQRRDTFIQVLECTRQASTIRADPLPSPGQAPLFVASSLLLKESDQRLVSYLYETQSGRSILPPLFPSLGTLARLAAAEHGRHDDARAGYEADAIDALKRQRSLSFVCEQAHASDGRSPAYEALLGPTNARYEQDSVLLEAYVQGHASRHGTRLFNWLDLESGQNVVQVRPLDGIAPQDLAHIASAEAPVQLLAMANQRGIDQLETRVLPYPVDGVIAHALTAADAHLPRQSAWMSLLEELFTGWVFVAILAAMHLRLHQAERLAPLMAFAPQSKSVPARLVTTRVSVWLSVNLRQGFYRATNAEGVTIAASRTELPTTQSVKPNAWRAALLATALALVFAAAMRIWFGQGQLMAIFRGELDPIWRLFIVAWTGLVVVALVIAANGLFRGQSQGWVARTDLFRPTSTLLLPLVVLVGVIGGVLMWATLLLQASPPHLLDPALTVIGLTIHAYVEVGQLSGHEDAEHGQRSRRSGLRLWLARWLNQLKGPASSPHPALARLTGFLYASSWFGVSAACIAALAQS